MMEQNRLEMGMSFSVENKILLVCFPPKLVWKSLINIVSHGSNWTTNLIEGTLNKVPPHNHGQHNN